jgi:hypothetical protein
MISHNESDKQAATTAVRVQEGADNGARAVEAQRVCSASSQQNETMRARATDDRRHSKRKSQGNQWKIGGSIWNGKHQAFNR